LLFKMHGNRSNIVLIQNQEVVSLFRNSLVKDWNLSIEGLNRVINQNWNAFIEEQGNLKKIYPTFGPLVNEVLKTSQFYSAETLQEKWEILQKILPEINNPPFYILDFEDKIHLSLLNLGKVLKVKDDPIEAINDFFYTYSRVHFYEKEKVDVLKRLEKQKQQALNYIQKTSQKLKELETGTKHDEIANIIMANLHQIPLKCEEVELFNFYDEKPIKIKLKKELSPQKNAETFYRKAKNQQIELEKLLENVSAKEVEVRKLEQHLHSVSEIEQVKMLRNYIKEHNLAQDHGPQQEHLPFKSFIIEGFNILVGKNAQSNDILTLKYAWKEDLWLHAKDVSGSHVIIKHQSGKAFPKNVIEKAAQIAAYYSKRKTDSLCPVIVTPKKYVRKRKGSAPGAVVVEKEEVVLVEPASFKETQE
jgi:predicted ribosome quality control (RQC) complex YloA/Tae2 family protein